MKCRSNGNFNTSHNVSSSSTDFFQCLFFSYLCFRKWLNENLAKIANQHVTWMSKQFHRMMLSFFDWFWFDEWPLREILALVVVLAVFSFLKWISWLILFLEQADDLSGVSPFCERNLKGYWENLINLIFERHQRHNGSLLWYAIPITNRQRRRQRRRRRGKNESYNLALRSSFVDGYIN